MDPAMDAAARDAVRRIAEAELSPAPRVLHGALLAVALTMTLVVVSLGLTEPDLPLRASLAFAVLAMIGMGWTGYAIWVLTRRRVLYARQRVVAARLAVTFTTIFTTGAFALGLAAKLPAGLVAGVFGLGLVTLALLLLSRARRRLATLTARMRQLEAQGVGA
ncbi:hypothetical protein [Sphingomonas sp. MS122]|uniref:hypothetical protein n=1 Tax=Sphingomonas sp. MS122 TaxID=3412683 RepID=UPI003C2C3A84